MSIFKKMFGSSDNKEASDSSENDKLCDSTLLSVKEVDNDFYKETLSYIGSSPDYLIAVIYDGGPNLPGFDNGSDCNFLKFNTIEEFTKWAGLKPNTSEITSESKLYETIINANTFWQIAEGELILEWSSSESLYSNIFVKQLKVWPMEDIIAYPVKKEDMVKSELVLSKNSILPSLRKFFGNGVDWVEQNKVDLKGRIKNLLIEKNIKIAVSDIDAFLKHQDVDEIKKICDEMYHNEEISFAGNGRYFVLTEGQEKPKKTSAPKSKEVDVEKELEKYKGLLDKGLITQEEYDAKRKQILGL